MHHRRRNAVLHTALSILFLIALVPSTPAADAQPHVPALRAEPGDRSLSPGRPGDAENRGGNFTDLPAEEISLGTRIGSVPSIDWSPTVFGTGDGEVAVLMLEDFRLRALYSADGAQTFDPEVDVVGGPGPGGVVGYTAHHSEDGYLYVALVVADPQGGRGLQFVQSADMGRTWTSPVTLVQHGDPSHDVSISSLRIDSLAGGSVAIGFRGSYFARPFVVSSSSYGDTWTEPVAVDQGAPPESSVVPRCDVALDGSANVHVVYAQDRSADGTANSEIWYARSTDAGLTFEPERSLSGLYDHEDSHNPDLVRAADGGLVVALFDYYDLDYVYALRSVDQGGSFVLELTESHMGSAGEPFPLRIATTWDGVRLAIFYVQTYGSDTTTLRARESTNYGRSFTDRADLSPSGSSGITDFAWTVADSGRWVVAWHDDRDDSYAGGNKDVYARSSIVAGDWGDEARVDSDPAGSSPSAVGGVAPTAQNEVLVVFRDGREASHRGRDVYGNRSDATNLSFGPDERLDADRGSVGVNCAGDSLIATDGDHHVYKVFSCMGRELYSEVYVARSVDGGYTFDDPVRVSRGVPAEYAAVALDIEATADGRVYVAYLQDAESDTVEDFEKELRLNWSSDFGETWQSEDKLLDWFLNYPPGYVVWVDYPAVDIEVGDGATVYAVWSDSTNVLFSRSRDGGTTWDIEQQDVDADAAFFWNRHPKLCASGDQLVLSYRAGGLYWLIYGTVSFDGGETWSPVNELVSGATADVHFQELDCGADQEAVVVWPDPRDDGLHTLYANRFDGSAWQGPVEISGPAEDDLIHPLVEYSSPDVVLVTSWGYTSAYVARSTDGGATFPSHQKLDDASPEPGRAGSKPRLATDGAGNVWISWRDGSAGTASVVARRSGDHGASYGPVRRVSREQPQGAYVNDRALWSRIDALPGVGFFGWLGQREAAFVDGLVNAWDVGDLDRDQRATEADCNDEDAGVWAAPAEVSGVAVSKTANGAAVSWSSQADEAGPGTVYDLVTGEVPELATDQGFDRAACLADDVASASYEDERSGPTPGGGVYYLVRAQNSCGTGTVGDASGVPDPRDELDEAGPCP